MHHKVGCGAQWPQDSFGACTKSIWFSQSASLVVALRDGALSRAASALRLTPVPRRRHCSSPPPPPFLTDAQPSCGPQAAWSARGWVSTAEPGGAEPGWAQAGPDRAEPSRAGASQVEGVFSPEVRAGLGPDRTGRTRAGPSQVKGVFY